MPAAFGEGGFAVGDVLVDGNGFDTTGLAKVGCEGLEHETDGGWRCGGHAIERDTGGSRELC